MFAQMGGRQGLGTVTQKLAANPPWTGHLISVWFLGSFCSFLKGCCAAQFTINTEINNYSNTSKDSSELGLDGVSSQGNGICRHLSGKPTSQTFC